MRILIDCSSLKTGGGIQVAISFIKDLKELEIDHEIIVVLSPKMNNSFDRKIFSDNFTFIDFGLNNYKFLLYRSIQLSKIENKIKPDRIFSVFGPSYYKSKCKKVVGFALPHYIYINSPFFKTLNKTERIKLYLTKKLHIYLFNRYSDELIFETEDARSIYLDKYNFTGNTNVVSNRLNQIFLHKEKWERISLTNNGYINILCMTADYPHKNISIIKDIIDLILELKVDLRIKFVITLEKDDLNFGIKYDRYIDYIGQVKIEQVPRLYEKCDIVLMPTLLEIFSTTYLEAMYMKKPLISSDMGFARDICKDAAIYFKPTSPKDALKKIIMLVKNDKLKSSLIINGTKNLNRFGTSLDRTRKYLSIIEK